MSKKVHVPITTTDLIVLAICTMSDNLFDKLYPKGCVPYYTSEEEHNFWRDIQKKFKDNLKEGEE